MAIFESVPQNLHCTDKGNFVKARKPQMSSSCMLEVTKTMGQRGRATRQEMSTTRSTSKNMACFLEGPLPLDRRTTKDERLKSSYCDMNNHLRFSCKLLKKHRDESAQHRCTLCIARHASFQCKRAQCNGGCTSQSGHVKSSNLQSRKIGLQTFDGNEMLLHLHFLLQPKLHLKRCSSRLQQSSSRCVQQQS